MIHKLIKHKFITRCVTAASALILIATSFSPAVSNAAKQSVNVSSTVYFTLDSASLTAGTDSQTLNFTLNLTNQSESSVDLNQYGVRVTDQDGNHYSAQLTEKASARVLAHQAQSYKYAVVIPSNISLSQLSVDMFAWDFSAATFMRDLGSIPATSATTTAATVSTSASASGKQVVLNLHDVDPNLPDSTLASFTLQRSYKTLKNGVWSVKSDVMVENLSAQAIQLPANLLFNLRDNNKAYILTSVISGGNQAIQPKGRTLLSFQAVLKTPDTSTNLSFELSKRPVLGVTANNLLGALSVDDSMVEDHVGGTVLYPTQAVNALNMIAEKATYTYQAFSNEIAVDFTLHNDGTTVVPVPKLAGTYQVSGSTLTIGASEAESHPETLAAKQSTTYHFTAQFPKSTDEGTLQLVIAEQKGATETPIDVIILPSSYAQGGEGSLTETTALDMKDFDPTLSKYSNLSFQVVRSYHAAANNIPTVNVDLVAENQSAVAMKLPATLAFNVKDSAGLSYPTTVTTGADQSIIPHQTLELTLQAAIGKKDTSTAYSLELIKKTASTAGTGNGNSAASAAGGTSSASSSATADISSTTATDTTSASTAQTSLYASFDLASSFANTKARNTVNSTIGKLGVTLKSTYRLATDSGDDILMSEVEIQNLDNKTITIPNLAGAGLYGGYMMNDFDAQGKVIRIQTSPYLYPSQKTTVYIYTKIPYTSTATDGYIYLGDGTLNSATSAWTLTHEWTELPYVLNTSAITPAAFDTEWMINDAGRASTGKVVDSQIYTINNQNMLAVRILQTNKEARNGGIVPYTGYLTNADGTVLALKTTDDSAATTKLSKDGLALSTLWTVLPSGYAMNNQQFVFGQKIDDQAFASPMQYTFSQTAAGSIFNASVYPYTLSLQNVKLANSTAGPASSYDINFDYAITKTLDAAGSAKDRSLVYTLTDVNGKVVKTWEETLEGADAWTTGKNKLTFAMTDIPDQVSFMTYTKTLNVYEKFEGGTRLLGSTAVSY
jgi:hypothetical protein